MFSLYIDQAIKDIEFVCWLQAYADDLILISEDYDQLIADFNKMKICFHRYNLEINMKKCNYLTDDINRPSF